MEEPKREFHFITQKRTILTLPQRDFSSQFVNARNGYRTVEHQRTEKISGIIKQIITTKQIPQKSEWSFSVQTCGNCGGTVIGGITCCACGIYICSNCRQTYTIDNGNYDITLCMLCSECFERMEQTNWFEQKIKEGEDKEVVLIHLKVTKTLLLFDETFRTMKAFEGVEGLNDENFLKECKERLREFQIVLKKVNELKELMKNFISKSEAEKRIIQNLFYIWSMFNKEKVLKAITFAQLFSKEIEIDEKKLEEIKDRNKQFEIIELENTVISSNGGVLKIIAENIDPSMKVIINGIDSIPTFYKNFIYLQIPKQTSSKPDINIQFITKYGNVQLFNTIFYDNIKHSSLSLNNINSSSSKVSSININNNLNVQTQLKSLDNKDSFNWVKTNFFKKFKQNDDTQNELSLPSIKSNVNLSNNLNNNMIESLEDENKKEIKDNEFKQQDEKKKLFVFEDCSSESNDENNDNDKKEESTEDDESSEEDDGDEEILFVKKPDQQVEEQKKENNFPKIQDDQSSIQEFNINTNTNGWKSINDLDDFEILDIDSMDIKMEILSLSPSAFSTKGGQLTIKGKNFGNQPIVFVRNKKVEDKKVLSKSPTKIIIILPPLTVGLVTIRIENEFGQSDSCVDAVRVFDNLPTPQ
ncbi:hypothetical protein EHI8A_077270 [Entamoeba histolytica HM-1:IMSS-B]|uniref:IPT/TIG domain-containing protein n=6 Tax=Entamoeba histolytica TaxID=5759 RepID=C4LVL8_ENTH1|nr:hypothetical protein EHI_103760 [Entamoeba histolytica HM-1:IMSS]EMD44111.1 Hypothetical protein EHI5A_116220 [Entamoeba histolytica KU27]EMH75574.1 hypothetical protein EHI8A_077270 [Entamoeba histolytica HM-1:IMSS-B]ENY64563.1 hypothetical protein EHI7A_075190 [Entamoeba histolytica HM-1:IMSS-A]GAT92717.1 hypothetical protein CL6EHI_103760 [Entamoeba histolytica]EAL47976.1 hypothetical protein EHI_103760 [Entamoeba histolytica HM-1:IMSS]|eukprot:XP_653362.1 hypothetical protein EHI_103760 [Entamoeba histolytica HM-1:IMSS]